MRDPFEMQSPDKIVTPAISRAWPIQITLPDLGSSYLLRPIAGTNVAATRASNGRVVVTPGVYLLSAGAGADVANLPRYIGHLRFDEFHPPQRNTVPIRVQSHAAAEYVSNRPVEITARVVNPTAPGSVTLSIRPVGFGFFRRFPMQMAGGYDYRLTIPADSLREGMYEYAITVTHGDSVTTFPSGVHKRPWDWDFSSDQFWTTSVVRPTTALTLFAPARDVGRLAFTRLGDNIRRGIFRLASSEQSGAPAFHLELPSFNGRSPEDYTVSLAVQDRIRARDADLANARSVQVRLRGLRPMQRFHLTLVERDGTSWSTAITADTGWTDRVIPLSDFTVGRGVMVPAGFPGNFVYWVGPATHRGGNGDRLRLNEVERLQLSLRPEDGAAATAGTSGVEIESVAIGFR